MKTDVAYGTYQSPGVLYWNHGIVILDAKVPYADHYRDDCVAWEATDIAAGCSLAKNLLDGCCKEPRNNLRPNIYNADPTRRIREGRTFLSFRRR